MNLFIMILNYIFKIFIFFINFSHIKKKQASPINKLALTHGLLQSSSTLQ